MNSKLVLLTPVFTYNMCFLDLVPQLQCKFPVKRYNKNSNLRIKIFFKDFLAIFRAIVKFNLFAFYSNKMLVISD